MANTITAFFYAAETRDFGFINNVFMSEKERDAALFEFLHSLWEDYTKTYEPDPDDAPEPTLDAVRDDPHELWEAFRADDLDSLWVDVLQVDVTPHTAVKAEKVEVPVSTMRLVEGIIATAHRNVGGGSDSLYGEALSQVRAVLPPLEPWQRVFRDFDYDYLSLIHELGEEWEDSSWGNDTSPSAMYRGAIRIWFDHADFHLSEHSEERAIGKVKQFTLSCDWPSDVSDVECGTIIFHTDDWNAMATYICQGGFARWCELNAAVFEEGTTIAMK